jgi:hypothetical protein
MNVPLPAEIASLLQDEAYATLCRESLSGELVKIRAAKSQELPSRPPFAGPGSSDIAGAGRVILRPALDNEPGLHTRLDQVRQIDGWLKEVIGKALQGYLPLSSPDYRCCQEACNVVARWDEAIKALQDLALALARDAHGVSLHFKAGSWLKSAPAPSRHARQTAMDNLRAAVQSIQVGLTEVRDIRTEFMRLCDTQADGLQLPEPPEFRDIAWVDHLASLDEAKVSAEVLRCETEARFFCANGMAPLLREGAEVNEACVDAGTIILAKYWRQLREHALSHYVKERDVDEVIASLDKHRQAAELVRRQGTFESAKVISLR